MDQVRQIQRLMRHSEISKAVAIIDSCGRELPHDWRDQLDRMHNPDRDLLSSEQLNSLYGRDLPEVDDFDMNMLSSELAASLYFIITACQCSGPSGEAPDHFRLGAKVVASASQQIARVAQQAVRLHHLPPCFVDSRLVALAETGWQEDTTDRDAGDHR